jgi:hypothetical protein
VVADSSGGRRPLSSTTRGIPTHRPEGRMVQLPVVQVTEHCDVLGLTGSVLSEEGDVECKGAVLDPPHPYSSRATPTAINQTDQATYATGVIAAASFQPCCSKAPTNSNEQIISRAPTTIPATPSHQGAFVA